MIQRFDSPAEASRFCAAARSAQRTLGFVPTMGALHDGHLELVARAVAENELACVSIFVNPLQFTDARDFERYPRDFAADAHMLEQAGCAMVFGGTLATFFPRELRSDGTFDPAHLRAPGASAEGLEGAFRPGHFAGVATIVARLFELVRPTHAYFGQKDYQQTLVVRDLAAQLGYPDVVVCPTSREPSGLARSSRNALLSAAERERAKSLSRALRAAVAAWEDGERDPRRLSEQMVAVLAQVELELEYATVRDPEHWTAAEPSGPLQRAVALIAARVGSVRLIDNERLDAEARA